MSARGLVERADAVLLDVDGVLCLGDDPIPGAAEAVAWLRACVPLLVATTNDSRRARAAQARRLARAGLTDAPVVTAVDALAATLLAGGHDRVAACGTEMFADELERLGVRVDAPRATAVAIGAGSSPRSIADGRELLARGIPAFAANEDAVVPTPEGPVPDTGAVVAALGCVPTYCGKPHGPMTRCVRPLLGAASKVVVIGDGIATDLAWARAQGWRAIFVGGDPLVDADAVVPTIGALAAATR